MIGDTNLFFNQLGEDRMAAEIEIMIAGKKEMEKGWDDDLWRGGKCEDPLIVLCTHNIQGIIGMKLSFSYIN
jgi:hypothetical protein